MSTPRVYEFETEDRNWKLALSKDFVALSCQSYRRWETFRQHFDEPFAAFQQIYQPAFFSRIGLRYVNLICRSDLGLDGTAWGELLKPHIAGALASEAAADVKQAYQQVCITLPNGLGKVTMRHGIGELRGGKEDCYIIDNDFFYDERSEKDDAIRRLDHFNRYSGRVFRWSIADRLDRAMVPEGVK